MNDEQARAAGERAFQELQQTEAAFARVRAAMIAELISTGPGADAKRDRLIVGCQIIDAVRQAMLDVHTNGQIAAHAISMAGLNRL